eukprot:COSAG06_NODE_2927_length_6081_cov_15.993313_5_plen_47_part_00
MVQCRDKISFGAGMLQVHNGSSVGCLVLYADTDEVVHEPVRLKRSV